MPEFHVVCKNAEGERRELNRSGDSREQVFSELREEGLVPISISEAEGEGGEAGGKKAEPRSKSGTGFSFWRKVKLDELAVAFRTLATMVGGGLPIIGSLIEVGEQADTPHFREAMLSMAQEVREGSSLSDTMAQRRDIFPPIAVSMVHAGEESGNLARVLSDLADYLEEQQELRRKVKSGTRYPMFVAGFFVVALAVIVLFVIPQFREIYDRFDVELPLLTRIVTGVSTAIASSMIYIIPVAGLLFIGFVFWKRTEGGRRTVDRVKLRLPLIGPLVHQIVIARFSRALSLLLESGIPVVEALSLSSRIADNVVIRDQVNSARDNIVQGSSLSVELENHSYFPRMLSKMASAGESSGQLGSMLNRVAVHFEREASSQIEGLLSLLEPAILVLLGVTVGFVVVAVYLPIFNLARAIG
ncbi:MAG: type II secretion system F family protein [Planctomycetota bacterium]